MSQGETDVARARFREVFAAWPSGVAVITALGPDGPAGMTASALCSLSLDPLLVLVCFDRGARTLAAVRAAQGFGINILAQGQEALAASFATKAAHRESFAAARWTERNGVPILDGVVAWLACSLHRLDPGGDHLIALGAVRAADHEPERRALLWHRGELGELP